MIRIRQVEITPEIAAELDALDETCFPDDEREQKAGTDLRWWLATEQPGGKIVGFAGLHMEGDGIAYLCRSGVLPSHRGQRIQRRLITSRVRYAARVGCSRVITYTRAYNHASNNSLIGAGFKLYAPQDPWVGERDVLYWYKVCRKPTPTPTL